MADRAARRHREPSRLAVRAGLAARAAALRLASGLASAVTAVSTPSGPLADEVRALAAMRRAHRAAARAQAALFPGTRIDRLGVPLVSGGEPRVWRALGFASARSHGFSMDLTRRRAEGSLADLLGDGSAEADARQRALGFAFYAERVVAALPPDQRALLDAYAEGVNALLEHAPPWEHAVLGTTPRPWAPEDSVLVAQDLFQQLTDPGEHELAARLDDLLGPGGGAALLAGSVGTTTALDGTPAGRPEGRDLLRAAIATARSRDGAAERRPGGGPAPVLGSNSWSTGTLLANDVHLPLGVPNTVLFARAVLDGVPVQGFLRPGVPVFLAGATHRIAWGPTRLCGRTSARLPKGAPGTEVVVDRVDGATGARIRLAEAGPVLSDGDVLRWLALEPGAVEFGLSALPRCRTAEQACRVATAAGSPPISLLITDRDGGQAWTVAGRVLARGGLVPPDDVPRRTAPASGVLVTANCDLAVPGPDGSVSSNAYPHDRARRITALLREGRTTEQVQSDVDASFYAPWREIFRPHLDRFPEAAAAVDGWDGTAGVGATGLQHLVLLHGLVRGKVLAPLRPRVPAGDLVGPGELGAFDAELADLVRARDPDLLPAGHRDWPHLLRWCAEAAVRHLERRLGPGAHALPWGAVNRVGLRHPMSARLPRLAWALDQPDLPRRGCLQSVDASAAGFGAALRLECDPVEGRFRVSWPGGQSGDPLSPGYRSLFADWYAGRLVSLPVPTGEERP
ncbi:penicillin acylase family protein [Actinosynnema pretiosum subsp. pretiosum]|uniref:Penicillin acylase family protein n=1 Tax=Actinosynnema pretiosum subsp. pretiosum TaxID=103721 RepID=A0AA45R3M1_9PSEU|nr:Penicillin amidase [Actinosynnema pretiosum subsp. pretiosum]QUF03720.1 penicillin acylase family protein [Actinosynnema pretiosum subsp. pretiosum]